MVENYNVVHFSAGDLLREEVTFFTKNKVKNQTEEGEFINNIIKEGKIVPVRITCELIRKAMSRHNKEKDLFIVDGFPRNEENYNGWCDTLKQDAHIVAILFLECPESVCEERILKRSEQSGRVDDNKASLVKRFNTFKEETIPLINGIETKGSTQVVRINANQSKEDVFLCLAKELDKLCLSKK